MNTSKSTENVLLICSCITGFSACAHLGVLIWQAFRMLLTLGMGLDGFFQLLGHGLVNIVLWLMCVYLGVLWLSASEYRKSKQKEINIARKNIVVLEPRNKKWVN